MIKSSQFRYSYLQLGMVNETLSCNRKVGDLLSGLDHCASYSTIVELDYADAQLGAEGECLPCPFLIVE